MRVPYLARSDHTGLPLLRTGNDPTQNDLPVHVSHGEGPSEPQFRNRHLLKVHMHLLQAAEHRRCCKFLEEPS